MTEPTSSPTNPADDPGTMAMRRRRDRYVASRLAGQAGSTLWDALIWVALAAGALWLAQRQGWPIAVVAAAGAVTWLAAMPQLQDWIIWRRDRNKPLSEAEIDRLAVIAIDGEEDPARAMPWRKQAERS